MSEKEDQAYYAYTMEEDYEERVYICPAASPEEAAMILSERSGRELRPWDIHVTRDLSLPVADWPRAAQKPESAQPTIEEKTMSDGGGLAYYAYTIDVGYADDCDVKVYICAAASVEEAVAILSERCGEKLNPWDIQTTCDLSLPVCDWPQAADEPEPEPPTIEERMQKLEKYIDWVREEMRKRLNRMQRFCIDLRTELQKTRAALEAEIRLRPLPAAAENLDDKGKQKLAEIKKRMPKTPLINDTPNPTALGQAKAMYDRFHSGLSEWD